MITRTHLDEAAALKDRLFWLAHNHLTCSSPSADYLARLYVRASKRYERRLDAYRPLYNLACLAWHIVIGPVLLCIRKAYEQVKRGTTQS